MSQIFARVITTPQHLDEARNVLYRVYCQDLGWYPPAGNPSGQRVDVLQSGVRGLVDAYDAHCTWIGLLHNNTVVGCMRLVRRRPDDNLLEIEHYFDLSRHLGHQLDLGRLVECNRLAIDPQYRSREGGCALHLRALERLEACGESVLIAARPATGRLAIEYMGTHDTGLSFKYHPQDPEDARVYLLKNEGTNIATQRRYLESRLSSLPM